MFLAFPICSIFEFQIDFRRLDFLKVFPWAIFIFVQFWVKLVLFPLNFFSLFLFQNFCFFCFPNVAIKKTKTKLSFPSLFSLLIWLLISTCSLNFFSSEVSIKESFRNSFCADYCFLIPQLFLLSKFCSHADATIQSISNWLQYRLTVITNYFFRQVTVIELLFGRKWL